MERDSQSGRTATGVGYTYSFSCLTPAQLAVVTGLSTELQRVWRRRDQLPVGTGSPARLTAKDAAEVLVRYELSRNGLPPSESGAISAEVAPSVLWFALLSADGACEILGEEATVTAFMDEFDNSDDIARQLSGVDSLTRFIWRADGGDVELALTRDDMGHEGEHLSVFYLDLSTAGLVLAERLGRPILTVELASGGSGSTRRVRRLTGRKTDEETPFSH